MKDSDVIGTPQNRFSVFCFRVPSKSAFVDLLPQFLVDKLCSTNQTDQMGQQKPVKRQKKKTKEDLIVAEKKKQKEKNKLEARIEDASKNVPITEELREKLGLEYQT